MVSAKTTKLITSRNFLRLRYDVTSVNSVTVTLAACDISSAISVIGYSMAPTVCDVSSVNSNTVVSAMSAVADVTSGEGSSHSVMTEHSILRKDLTIDAAETQCTSNLGALQSPEESIKEEWGIGESDESVLDPAFSRLNKTKTRQQMSKINASCCNSTLLLPTCKIESWLSSKPSHFMAVFAIAARNLICIEPEWIPRAENQQADFLS